MLFLLHVPHVLALNSGLSVDLRCFRGLQGFVFLLGNDSLRYLRENEGVLNLRVLVAQGELRVEPGISPVHLLSLQISAPLHHVRSLHLRHRLLVESF